MIRLPGVEAVGDTPNANSGRPVASIDLSGGARGLQQLGAGMQQAGDNMLDLARQDQFRQQRIDANRERKQSFKINTDLSTMDQGLHNDFEPQKTKASEDGVGFQKDWMGVVAQRQKAFLSTVPPEMQDRVKPLLDLQRTKWEGIAAKEERAIGTKYTAGVIWQDYETYRKQIDQDPNSRDVAEKVLNARIDQAPYFDAATKADMKQRMQNGIEIVQWQKLYGKDPEGGARAFGRGVATPPAAMQPLFMAEDKPSGLVSAGNIDLRTRPMVKNADGTTSTVKTISYERNDGKEVLIPTVSDEGKIMSNREAMKYWGDKGQNLGVFDTPDQATAYAKKVHEQQDDWFLKGGKEKAAEVSQRTSDIALPKGQIGPQQADRENFAMSYFMGRGYSRDQAAGIVGNLVHESGGLNVKSLNPSDGSDGSDSIGIAQWNGVRAKNLKTFAAAQGKDWHDLSVQLAFVDHELNTSYSDVKEKLLKSQSADDAAGIVVTGYERPKGSEGGAVLSHGWSNRRTQARRLAGGSYNPGESEPGGGYSAPDPRFSTITLDQQNTLLRQAGENQVKDKGEVTSLMKDDLASMEMTGQGVSSLTPDRVRGALGDDAVNAWLRQRQLAQSFHDATADFDTLPDALIPQRLASLAPAPGQEGFVDAQKTYVRAQQLADATLQNRYKDPAGSVSAMPDVAKASEGANLSTPSSYAPLVQARLQAQTRLGIPDAMQSPMTLDEAQRFLAPINKAIPGQEKAVMRQVMSTLGEVYGPHADQALAYMMAQGKVDKETQGIAATLFRKLGLGQPITRDDARAFDDAQKLDASNNAIAGVLGPNQGGFPTPDMGAIGVLRANPSLASQFDQVYGAGRAAQILSFQPPAPPVAAPEPPDAWKLEQQQKDSAARKQLGDIYGGILPPNTQPSAGEPPPAGKSDVPPSGADAFNQARQQFQDRQ